jgi:predicted transposase YbfD/YdcC
VGDLGPAVPCGFLLQDLDGDVLDAIVGGWLRRLAAGKPGGLTEHVAIDGKWLRGVGDGPVKLLSALRHGDGVIIAQTRIRDETNETTQGKALLDHVDLTGAVVTADAAHASRETAQYIAGERGADYLLTVKGNTPGLQRAIYDKIQAECDAAAPDHSDTDRGHGRTVRRSLWTAAAGQSTGFPHAAQVIRIRRDTLDIDGTVIAKEIVHAATSLDAVRGTPAALAALARGQWAIEAVHWIRPRHRLPRGPRRRLRRRRPPGHGHPPQHGHQPAPPRRDHRDRPHPPGLQP